MRPPFPMLALLGLLCALAIAPAPAGGTEDLPALGATTVLSGSAPASMLVRLDQPATFVTPERVDDRSFTVDVPAGGAAGFVLEPVGGATGETVLGVQFPEGWGFDGGIDQLVNPVGAADVELPVGTYRLYLLTEPGQDTTVTIPLEGLDGSTVLTPDEPAGFELDFASPQTGPAGTTELRHTATHDPLPGGGWIVSGASFLGAPGSAQSHSLCHLHGGPADEDLTHASPLCVPRSTVFTGRGGHSSVGPSIFAALGDGASAAFYMTSMALPGETYGTNHYHSAYAPKEAHLGTVWIARGQGVQAGH